MNQQLNQSIITATEEVFETLLGTPVLSGQPEQKPINKETEETTVVISFMGEVSGAFTLKCSKQTAFFLTGKMLGSEEGLTFEDIKDAAGELLNMIVGSALTHYSANDRINISIPTTIIGEDYSMHIKAEPDDMVSYIPFQADAANLAIDVYVK
jgi:CheY-specific phosphatase CheX